MDVSGSMGEFKKYIARSFFFWMVRFLRTKYDNVEIVFISHHTEAKEVTEEQFFTQGESGGTVVSSAYQLALDIIRARFPPRDWNVYPFHFSDGDNYYSDNEEAVRLADELIETCNLFGYGEIGEEGAAVIAALRARCSPSSTIGCIARNASSASASTKGGRVSRAQTILRAPRRRSLTRPPSPCPRRCARDLRKK